MVGAGRVTQSQSTVAQGTVQPSHREQGHCSQPCPTAPSLSLALPVLCDLWERDPAAPCALQQQHRGPM